VRLRELRAEAERAEAEGRWSEAAVLFARLSLACSRRGIFAARVAGAVALVAVVLSLLCS
jgi:hypothetical protein